MRLFIAIELPDDIKKVLSGLKVDIPGAHWVSAEQVHLTLAFLGEVDESTVERLTGKLANIRESGFKLNFGRIDCYPNRHRPRVLWIGLEPQPKLNDLAVKVRAAMLACSIPYDERHFSPHITLARLKLSPSREFDEFLARNIQLKLPPFSVREFTLFQSRLTSQGAQHIPLKSFPLAADPSALRSAFHYV